MDRKFVLDGMLKDSSLGSGIFPSELKSQERNPVVYSRYSKKARYDANEKFDEKALDQPHFVNVKKKLIQE